MTNTEDQRRNSPLHYWARAENARAAGYLLSKTNPENSEYAKKDIGYCGDLKVALGEAFRREASFAIESALKGLICRMIELGQARELMMTHNVYLLWQNAGLDEPDSELAYFLIEVTEILIWSGRYAAPLPNKKWRKTFTTGHVEMAKNFAKLTNSKGLTAFRTRPFDWEAHDLLWQQIESRYNSLTSSPSYTR